MGADVNGIADVTFGRPKAPF